MYKVAYLPRVLFCSRERRGSSSRELQNAFPHLYGGRCRPVQETARSSRPNLQSSQVIDSVQADLNDEPFLLSARARAVPTSNSSATAGYGNYCRVERLRRHTELGLRRQVDVRVYVTCLPLSSLPPASCRNGEVAAARYPHSGCLPRSCGRRWTWTWFSGRGKRDDGQTQRCVIVYGFCCIRQFYSAVEAGGNFRAAGGNFRRQPSSESSVQLRLLRDRRRARDASRTQSTGISTFGHTSKLKIT